MLIIGSIEQQFHCQISSGIVLHRGKNNDEGKTMASLDKVKGRKRFPIRDGSKTRERELKS